MPNNVTALLKALGADLREQIAEAHRQTQEGRLQWKRCKAAAQAVAVLVGRSDDTVRRFSSLYRPAGVEPPAADRHFIGGARSFARSGEVVAFTALPTHRFVLDMPAPRARSANACALSTCRTSSLSFALRWSPRSPVVRARRPPRREIVPGDVVEVKPGGGSLMNVRTIFEAVALCSWFDPNGRKCTDVFLLDSLQVCASAR